MADIKIPYLQIYPSDGKTYAYYRREGVRVNIGALPNEPGFIDHYARAAREWELKAREVVFDSADAEGSLGALITNFKKSPEFRKLSDSSKRDYRLALDEIHTRFGTVSIEAPDRQWVFRMRDEKSDTPRMANYRVAIIRRLFSWAVDRGFREDNPALKIGAFETGEGHRTWTAEELAIMTSPEAREIALPVLIGYCTAQRRGDVLALPWIAYDGSTLTFVQSKTGTRLVLPVPKKLKDVLNEAPRKGDTICTTSSGIPWTEDHFSHRFAEVRAQLGLPDDLHFHGLRHTRLTALAESGATEAEIMATGGHKTPAMAARYTRHANQQALALKASERQVEHEKKVVRFRSKGEHRPKVAKQG